MEMTKQQCIEAAEREEQKAAELEARYPGVRPGWVSTDIGMALAWAARYRKMAADGRK